MSYFDNQKLTPAALELVAQQILTLAAGIGFTRRLQLQTSGAVCDDQIISAYIDGLISRAVTRAIEAHASADPKTIGDAVAHLLALLQIGVEDLNSQDRRTA